MKVLIACEFSGTVRDAFIRRGHDAISCDLLPSESDFGPHIQGNVLEELQYFWKYDLIIAHPPCQYLTVAGNKWFKPEYADRFPDREYKRIEAINFFMLIVAARCERIAIENPIGIMSTAYRKPDQIIQPYEYGHTDRKPTCLWLKNLPTLTPTNIVEPKIKRNRNGKTASVHHDAALKLPADERWKVRSRTYQGIADAMAEQWGK